MFPNSLIKLDPSRHLGAQPIRLRTGNSPPLLLLEPNRFERVPAADAKNSRDAKNAEKNTKKNQRPECARLQH